MADPKGIVVVGASAGGVAALKELVSVLPGDLQAAVGVVLQVSPDAPSRLPQILSREGPLRAILAGGVDEVLALDEIGRAVIDFAAVGA